MNGTIDLADVPLFLAVARAGSFVAASRRTGTPPSTMSRAIARLEDALGARLFERTSRRVSLTRAGAELLERAGALASELEAVLDDVSSRDRSPRGAVRISAPLWIGAGRIAESLLAFAAVHPRIQIDLQLSNAVVDLVDGGFDLAFRAGPVAESSLVARLVWEVPFVLAASPDFVKKTLRGARAITRERLASLPVITTTASWGLRAADGQRLEVSFKERVRTNDPRVAIEAARRGLGVVRAPLEAVTEANLVPLTCRDGEVEPRPVYVVFASRRFVPRRVRAVIDWITNSR